MQNAQGPVTDGWGAMEGLKQDSDRARFAFGKEVLAAAGSGDGVDCQGDLEGDRASSPISTLGDLAGFELLTTGSLGIPYACPLSRQKTLQEPGRPLLPEEEREGSVTESYWDGQARGRSPPL